MKLVCMLGWCVGLALVFVFPCPRAPGIAGALMLLGFSLALIVLFAGFLARVLGSRRSRVKWTLIAVIVLSPAAVFGIRSLNAPDAETRIEATIRAVATSGDPAYCETRVTTAYLEQTTGARPPFADDVCRSEAGVSPADSVSVSEIAVSGDRATATVANRGGSFDGSRLRVALVNDDGAWKLDRLVAFEEFDRKRFDRAYRGLLLASGATPDATVCALEKTGALSSVALERALLGEASRVFLPIAVACDRSGAERRTVQAMASTRSGFPPSVVECAAAKLRSSSEAELVRVQQSPIAYNELLLSCNPEALVDFQRRQLSRNDALGDETIACVLAAFRRLPPVEAIRLTYDEARYERVVERCS